MYDDSGWASTPIDDGGGMGGGFGGGFGAAEMVMRLVGTIYTFFAVLALVYVALGISMYVIARWRTNREAGGVDPHLGLKFGLSYFKFVSFQTYVAGFFFVAYGLLSKQMPHEVKEAMLRTGFAAVLVGALVWGVHTVALARTNAKLHPTVTRLFAGLNMIVTGIPGFFSLLAVIVVAFQKGSNPEASRLTGSAVLVYTSAWILVTMWFVRSVGITGYPESGYTFSGGGPSLDGQPPTSSGSAP